jgi:hypothetical protein
MKPTPLFAAAAAWGSFALVLVRPATAAELKILLPLGRTAYQTNEWIDISIVRSAADGLRHGQLELTLTGADGSRLDIGFAVSGADGKPARKSEHLHINGYLLRPGNYTVLAAADGASASATLEIYSHLRKSTFKIIDWGSRAAKHEQAVLGADSFGYNLMMYAYGGIDVDEMIRGGLDYIRNCAMGGWHYMDMRRECDWSDPYVLGGGLARLSRQVFQDRVNPNCIGVHFYDEPLLAEIKDPTDPTGQRMVRQGIPAQERSFKSAFGQDAPRQRGDGQRWRDYNRWRLLLLEAAWKIGCFDVTAVQPDYLPTSQNQWAWHAFDAGYYFNVNRPFPVISRHAWYDYKHGGDFAPSFSYEFGRIRDLTKPNWYLPMWGSGHNDLYRAEQYLSFMNNLHGAAKPPDLLAHRPSKCAVAQAIVESNQAMARLGTIFESLPVSRAPLAVLYSMSHNLHEGTRDAMDSYRGNRHFQELLYLYMASKILHIPLFPVVDEDVADGSLAAHHKAVLLAGIDYLDPAVLTSLETFAAHGGSVLLSADSHVQIQGAKRYDLPAAGLQLIDSMERWAQEKQWSKWSDSVFTHAYFKAAHGVAEALKPHLAGLGVEPVFDCDQAGIVASRQSLGDVEYLFAVNASPDFDSFGWYNLRSVTATLGLAGDRPAYDALRGGRVEQIQKLGDKQLGHFRFGPGQMRVFARTSRPIGGVQVLPPILINDYTVAQNPVRVELAALLVDDRRQTLCGSAPMRVEVVDPLGVHRYDLYRATERGMLRLALPLAANDPAGMWTVIVHDLLGQTRGEAAFSYRPPAMCGAVAGATQRAVVFGRERENVFRFFRTHKDLTIVKGSAAFHGAVAERLVQSLEPWDIRCKIIAAADVKRREPTAKEKPTWVDAAGAYDLRGPVILLGSPDDNALIRHLGDQKFLPYTPVKDQFPGTGRGLVAWQREGLGYFGQESLTLIAYDEKGLAEAVGTAYEISAGQDPLTPWTMPEKAIVSAAKQSPRSPGHLEVAWQMALTDRPAAMRAVPGGMLVLTEDGTLSAITTAGKLAWHKTFAGGEAIQMDVSRDGRLIAVGVGRALYALDDRGRPLFQAALDYAAGPDPERTEGVSLIAVAPDGSRIVTGISGYYLTAEGWQASGLLCLCDATGKKLWTQGGRDPKTNKPLFPDRFRFGAFVADGAKCVVMTEKKTHLIAAANGTLDATLDGTFPVAVPLGENMLVGDGDKKLMLYSPGQGKVIRELDCAATAPVTFAAAASEIVVGTETDGTVRRIKAVQGSLAEQAVWRNQVTDKIVKRVMVNGEQVAVTYWGGTIRLLDGSGKLQAEQVFSRDIAVLQPSAGGWVVGLADGEIMALKPVGVRP